jgi:peptidoglycan/xylan/chitin deacetylase (PgdA/CDA1 family)
MPTQTQYKANYMGKFIVSLDFELFWGIFDKYEIEDKVTYFENTLQAIPQMLKLFEQNEIHVTWATVGALMANNLAELRSFYPTTLPDFENKKLSASEFIKANENKINSQPYQKYFFAPHLVELIKNTRYQEIGTHTFLHNYSLEKGQTINSFEADISAAKKIAKEKFDIDIKSIVFPRNQYNANYIQSCLNNGLVNIRVNPNCWYLKANNSESEKIYHRVFRTLEAYLPIRNASFKNEKNIRGGIHPSSRFLRPVKSTNLMYSLQLNRVLNEMTNAAKTNSNYHLWWHPHNFGNNVSLSIEMLKQIIKHFQKLNSKYSLVSANMSEV